MVKYETSDGRKWWQQSSMKCDLFEIEEYNKKEKIHATG
jgi:hypothetical protein